eukprot:7266789-Pyramimonas_sp.AAC.1
MSRAYSRRVPRQPSTSFVCPSVAPPRCSVPTACGPPPAWPPRHAVTQQPFFDPPLLSALSLGTCVA